MNYSKFRRWKSALFPVFVLFSIVPFAIGYGQDEDDLPLIVEVDASQSENSENVVATYADTPSADPALLTSTSITPDEAYRQLVAGNARYLKEDSEDARALPKHEPGQNSYPLATILYSLDMPVLPTTLTQTTDYDVYLSGITAGAVSSEDFAAIEYGLLNLQTPLLVVMGHYPSRDVSNLIRKYDLLEQRAKAESAKITQSGSKTLPTGATSEEMKLYNLLGPAIARSKEAYPDLQGYDLANIVSEALVWQSLETILMKSTVAQDLVRAGQLNIIAAISDDNTGKIYWLGEHPLQEEFLRPTPENLRNAETSNEILTEAEFPEALDASAIQEYVVQYESNTYYNDVITDYYVQPVYYLPSWELFSARAWRYRPWYGVWVEPFTPWPYWRPWGYPPGIDGGIDVSIWDGRLNFYIGYNRYWGPYHSWDPHFRPRSSWWSLDVFINPSIHVHADVFDLIREGKRAEIRHEPFENRPWHTPAPHHGHSPNRPDMQPRHDEPRPHPQSVRPSAPNVRPNIGDRPDSPGPNRPVDGYRPGDARPGAGSRFGSPDGIGGNRGLGGMFRPNGPQPRPSVGSKDIEPSDSKNRGARTNRPGIIPGILGGRPDQNSVSPSGNNATGDDKRPIHNSQNLKQTRPSNALPSEANKQDSKQPKDSRQDLVKPNGRNESPRSTPFNGRGDGRQDGKFPSRRGAYNFTTSEQPNLGAKDLASSVKSSDSFFSEKESLNGVRPPSLSGNDSLRRARPTSLKNAGIDRNASPLPFARETKTPGAERPMPRGSLEAVRPSGISSTPSPHFPGPHPASGSFGPANRGTLSEIGALRNSQDNSASGFSGPMQSPRGLPHAGPSGPSPSGALRH